MNNRHQIQIVAILLFLGAYASSSAQIINGKIYGGGEIALVDGNANVKVYSGTVGSTDEYNGGVFGGGLGQATVVTGDVSVTIGKDGSARDAEGPTINGDVYGGSALGNTNCSTGSLKEATPDKTTSVTLNAGTINGSMYGGALGQKTGAGDAIAADVYGPVSVNVYGGLVLRREGDDGGLVSGGIYGCNNLNGSPHAGVAVDIWQHNTATYAAGYSLFAVYGGGNQADYTGGTPNVTVHNCDNNIEYVYGGGNAAHLTHATDGNTNVVIWGGNTIGNVFGGGNGQAGRANVAGNTSVTIHGGRIGNVFCGSNTDGLIAGTSVVTVLSQGEAGTEPCVMDVTNLYGGGNRAPGKPGMLDIVCTGTGKIDNVYGGANQADLAGGDISLTIKGGWIGNVFGGNNQSGDIDGSIAVNVDWTTGDDACGNNHITNVYGGGNQASFRGNPVVNIKNGNISQNVYGGGLGASAVVTGNPVVTIGDGEDATKHAVVEGDVFGGGAEANVEGHPTVNVVAGAVRNNVYGGGALANISGNTTVNLTGGAVGGAFGGALGSTEVAAKVGGDTYVHLDGSKVIESGIFGANNLNGTPTGHVKVHVTSTTPRDGEDYDVPAVYGGGNLSAYEPTDPAEFAEVLIENCNNSIEYVYGGGNAAPVPAAKVAIYGANAIDNAFAGGNGAGAGNPGADIGYLGYYSSGSATGYGTGEASLSVYGGTVHHVYGGSNTLGYIRTRSDVYAGNAPGDYTGTVCASNVGEVFGGGNEAEMVCDVVVNMDCNAGAEVLYAGANNADIKGSVTLNISSGAYKKVFCGNNQGGKIYGSLKVNIDETGCYPVMIGELYGGGNEAPYSVYGYQSDGSPRAKSDFDALSAEQKASLGLPYDSPEVNVISATKLGKVFGGGFGEGATVYGDPHVNINTIKGAFAGQPCTPKYIINDAGEWVSNTSEITIADEPAAIGTVYGGGNAARVEGSTYVKICPSSTTTHVTGSDTATPAGSDVKISDDVYGGGLGETAVITGNTDVRIMNKTYIGNNVYGGGNGGNVEGDTKVVIGE